MTDAQSSPKMVWPVCCYCDNVLSCAACGREQPADTPEAPGDVADLAKRLDEHAIRYANDYGYGVATDLKNAAAALRRSSAVTASAVKRADEQTELAAKSIRRLAEKTEPGEIGAFASRDHWKAKCEAAEDALKKIAAMDPKGIRADDLGRAARIAAEAVAGRVGKQP